MPKKKPASSEPHNLIDCLQDIDDPRIDRTRKHNLIDILVIGLCSMITVGENFTDMEDFGKAKYSWLKGFLELPDGIPSHDTFNRVFSAIDPACFLECFIRWVSQRCSSLEGEMVAMDGKALRRSLDEGHSIPYIISAWASDNGLVLGQVKVDEKSNEITAIPELLRVLELEGSIVTIDAMGCQKDIAALIIGQQADYILALKGNHATVHDEVRAFFEDAVSPCAVQCADTADSDKMDFFKTVEKGHGRVETRRYWQTTDIDWFADKSLCKDLRSFGMVESIRKVKGKSTIERRYYLSSLALDAQTFGAAVRKHWGVENKVHWTMDVIFGEDQSRARAKNAAQNLASLRRIVLNLLKKDHTKNISLRRKRTNAALDEKYLASLIGI